MLETGLSCLPWGCTCLVLKLHFLKDVFARQAALEKPVAPWEEQCGCLSVQGCYVAKAERCRGTLEKLCCSTTLHRARFSSFPCAYAPHWFCNYTGSVLLSICMLTLRNTGENEQEQCKKPESRRSKVGDPGCICGVFLDLMVSLVSLPVLW